MFFFFVLFLTHSIHNKITYAQVSIVPHGSLALLEPLVLECQVTSFSGGATWSQDYGVTLLTQCFSGGLCTDSGSGNYQYFGNNTGIFVTIVSLTADEKGITWTCSHSTHNASYTIPEPGLKVTTEMVTSEVTTLTKTDSGYSFELTVGISIGSSAAIFLCLIVMVIVTIVRHKKSRTKRTNKRSCSKRLKEHNGEELKHPRSNSLEKRYIRNGIQASPVLQNCNRNTAWNTKKHSSTSHFQLNGVVPDSTNLHYNSRGRRTIPFTVEQHEPHGYIFYKG